MERFSFVSPPNAVLAEQNGMIAVTKDFSEYLPIKRITSLGKPKSEAIGMDRNSFIEERMRAVLIVKRPVRN